MRHRQHRMLDNAQLLIAKSRQDCVVAASAATGMRPANVNNLAVSKPLSLYGVATAEARNAPASIMIAPPVGSGTRRDISDRNVADVHPALTPLGVGISR